MRKTFPITTLLDNVRSALNVGAMFRTAEASGVEKFLIGGISPYPPHKRIPKTALGAIDNVDWEHHKDSFAVIKKYKKTHQIISVEISENSKNYTDIVYNKPTLLIFGNEISGVDKKIQQESHHIAHIPMFGDKESLNVATTYGIFVYEILRQWEYKL